LETINEVLKNEGFCLTNLPSVSDLTFAGLIATGTHATGLTHKILAAQMVLEIEFVNGKGEIMHTSESDNPSLFKAMLCSLGALGIIT
jgi:FAD/FMN-containing dehydrogenase